MTPTAPKVRQVLAFLLVRCGHLVQVDELIDELWSQNPPNSAMTTLQTYIYKLRKDVLEHCAGAELHTRISGYQLDAPVEHGDLSRFDALAQEGRVALDDGDPATASARLTEALALWRGPALADVTVGDILSAHVTRLGEERLRVLEQRITADLELGRHQQLVSELKMLVSEHPLNERFYLHLMDALNRSERRYEALETYQGLRRRLVDELGMEPSASVQRLHMALLDPDTAGTPARVRTVPWAVSAVRAQSAPSERLLVPAQLPPDIRSFVGRSDELERVRGHLMDSEGEDTVGRAVCISGMPGSGKTTLAVRAGHMARSEFPDGQLYADLQGTLDHPAEPHRILEGFLQAIGVPPHKIPGSLQECAKLFRTWSTGRRILVVLDDAHSMTQIAALLPASSGSVVIITSRWGLYSLPGVGHVELGEMRLGEAVQVMESASGRSYEGRERQEAERAAELCGRLPIALRALGSRLAAVRDWPIKNLVSQLEDAGGRLDLLTFADLDVRARFSASYRRLDQADRSMFRLVSLLPPGEFSAGTVARLVGVAIDLVETQLIHLVGCNLLSVADSAAGEIQFRMPELLRIFARERLNQELLEPVGIVGDDPAAAPDPRGAAPLQGPRPGERSRDEQGREQPDGLPGRMAESGHRDRPPRRGKGFVRLLREG